LQSKLIASKGGNKMRHIRYKVVQHNRESAICPNPKYVLEYPKGKIVKAKKHTVGILVFETYHQAEKFKLHHTFRGKILQVRPIGKKKRNPHALSYVEMKHIRHWRQYVRRLKDQLLGKGFKLSFPPGTCAYNAVEVLT
jgi:hypothetical protein